MTLNIETLVEWSAAKPVETRNGPRLLRKAKATESFWIAWRSGKDALKAAGVSCSPVNRNDPRGAWEACWWLPVSAPVPGAPVASAVAKPTGLSDEQKARLVAVTSKLLPYQVASVSDAALALAVHGGELDASDTGTGKTYVSIAASIVLGQPLYVVCPIAVLPSWKIAAKHFGAKLAGACNYELLKRGNLPELSIVKVKDGHGKEVEQFQWNLPSDTIIAFDECHRLKDPKTLNNAMGMAALRQGFKVMGLSATAADNPMQMKFAARLTSQVASDKAFFGWMLRHGVVRGRFGLEFSGSKQVLAKIHHDIFPSHGTRIKIDDLGDAFPETQIGNEFINLNGQSSEIDRIYREMEAEIAKIEESEMEDKGACILTVRLRARQRAEVLKVPAVVQYIQDKIEENMSVAIFVNFDDTLDAIAAKLGTKCVIRGGQKPEERGANIQAFQADREPVILCNIKAGGVGVSLHGNRNSRMRFSGIFPSDSGQDVKQAVGRVWRAGGAKSIQRIFIASGTIEEAVYGNVIDKIGRIDMLNNGDGSAKTAAAPVADVPQPKYVPVVEIADPVAKSAVAVPGSAPVAAAPEVSEELRELVHWACQTLSGLDPDHAGVINGVGWNGTDGNFGHSLANQSHLSAKQILCGAKMIRKYHGQLGGESFLAKLDAAMPKK